MSSGKEFLKQMLQSFFIIVTLINIVTFILGSIYRPGMLMGYEGFLSPIIYALFSMIPYGLTYSKKELSIKQVIFRKALQLITTIVILDTHTAKRMTEDLQKYQSNQNDEL